MRDTVDSNEEGPKTSDPGVRGVNGAGGGPSRPISHRNRSDKQATPDDVEDDVGKIRLTIFEAHDARLSKEYKLLADGSVDSDGGTQFEVDVKSAQARLNWIRKFRKNRKQPPREKAVQDVVAAPPPAPYPRRQQPSQRDSLASLREAARKRRGVA